MNIRQQIKETLTPLGISQSRLAAMAGVSQSVISRAVSGKRSVTGKTLERLWPYIDLPNHCPDNARPLSEGPGDISPQQNSPDALRNRRER